MAAESRDSACRQLIECRVCLELMKDARILPCGHRYCADCCYRLLEEEGREWLVCPECRAQHHHRSVIKDFALSREFLHLFSLVFRVCGQVRQSGRADGRGSGSVPAANFCNDRLQLLPKAHARHGTLQLSAVSDAER